MGMHTAEEIHDISASEEPSAKAALDGLRDVTPEPEPVAVSDPGDPIHDDAPPDDYEPDLDLGLDR